MESYIITALVSLIVGLILGVSLAKPDIVGR